MLLVEIIYKTIILKKAKQEKMAKYQQKKNISKR